MALEPQKMETQEAFLIFHRKGAKTLSFLKKWA
jgi:hypothetical protein